MHCRGKTNIDAVTATAFAALLLYGAHLAAAIIDRLSLNRNYHAASAELLTQGFNATRQLGDRTEPPRRSIGAIDRLIDSNGKPVVPIFKTS